MAGLTDGTLSYPDAAVPPWRLLSGSLITLSGVVRR